MNKFASITALSLVLLATVACTPAYTLVKTGPAGVVGRAFYVQPMSGWNKATSSGGGSKYEETWTRNGPLLDSIVFIGGLPDGKALVTQDKKAAKQVPIFHSNMSPIDLASMLESLYRVRGEISVFEVGTMEPTRFLGAEGMAISFRYVGGDQLARRGRCVLAVIDGKLYAMQLEGATSHYFEALTSEFDLMAQTATIKR